MFRAEFTLKLKARLIKIHRILNFRAPGAAIWVPRKMPRAPPRTIATEKLNGRFPETFVENGSDIFRGIVRDVFRDIVRDAIIDLRDIFNDAKPSRENILAIGVPELRRCFCLGSPNCLSEEAWDPPGDLNSYL